MNTCKETACTKCIHRDVCSLKEIFLTAQKKVDEILIFDEMGETTKLADMVFIKPVELQCTHWVKKPEATLR